MSYNQKFILVFDDFSVSGSVNDEEESVTNYISKDSALN